MAVALIIWTIVTTGHASKTPTIRIETSQSFHVE
jgi:hypothetical protein